MSEIDDWNAGIIAEFRANGGKVGGQFEGASLLLLHATGARSGIERINPLVYQAVGESFAIFASKAGADTNPDWYHNVVAHPNCSVEVGAEAVDVRARVLMGDEREAVWSTQKALAPGFAEYEQKTTRVIPVVVLERR